MPVTNYTFNFGGTDAPSDATVNHSASGPVTLSLLENGVNFTFSAQAGTNLSNFSSSFAPLSVSGGTVTLTINDSPSEEFFSNLRIDFNSTATASPFASTNTITLIRTKSAGGATIPTVTAKITNGQITSGAVVTAPAGQWNQIKFTSSGFMILDSITATINCFLEGTAIATESGEAPVETLQPGDLLRTADGALTQVTWVAHQRIEPSLEHPATVNPICIRAGALGDGVPERDLYVSRDHAIEIDGALYDAGTLVNGSSIFQVAKMPRDGFTYYHIETDAHELLLAEGCAAESYIDHGAVPRETFDNAAEAAARPSVPEMPLMRISSARLVPEHIRARLAARAEDLALRRAA